MNKKYTANELPLTTSNAALALSLYLSGAPFADNESPLVNIYDGPMLSNMGFTGNIEEGVANAFASNRKGHVEYAFARTQDFLLALGAFNGMQKAEERDLRAAAPIFEEQCKNLTTGTLTQTEAISASVCLVIKRWRGALTTWSEVPDFKSQRNKHVSHNYDAREQTEKVFLTGNFYAFAATVLDAREAFLKLWKNYPPQIRFREKGSVSNLHAPKGEQRIKAPGFAILTTGSPDNEIRRHLKLPTK